MRRTLLIFIILLGIVISNPVNAQLLVDSNGNIAIKYSSSHVNSQLSVNSPGDSTMCSFILSNASNQDVGLRLLKRGTVNTPHNFVEGIRCTVKNEDSSNKLAYGLCAMTHRESGTDTNIGRSYGIFALAGNSTPGWNYGVLGTLYGNNNGAGVFGSSSNSDYGMNTNGKYAGFFHGDVKTTDAMYATVYNTVSDFRLKENIEPIDLKDVDKLMSLNIVKYNLKTLTTDSGDTTTTQQNYYTDDSRIIDRTHYGLLAQEIQDVYPDLVYEADNGFLSVNYIELIPILIQSIQTLQNEIEILKERNNKTLKRFSKTSSNETEFCSSIKKIGVSEGFVSISCAITNTVKDSFILICDTNGNELYKILVKERGNTDVEVNSVSLNEGLYVCSLVTDNEIDTRRFFYGK